MQNIAGKIAKKKLRAAFSPSFFLKKENIYILFIFIFIYLLYLLFISKKIFLNIVTCIIQHTYEAQDHKYIIAFIIEVNCL